MTQIVLAILPETLSIHRLPSSTELANVLADIDRTNTTGKQTLFAALHSQQELSIVCDATLNVTADHSSGPWRAMYVVGQLDFALTGILAGLAAPLAAAEISIFAISSFDTDYLLIKADALDAAVTVLEEAGYRFGRSG